MDVWRRLAWVTGDELFPVQALALLGGFCRAPFFQRRQAQKWFPGAVRGAVPITGRSAWLHSSRAAKVRQNCAWMRRSGGNRFGELYGSIIRALWRGSAKAGPPSPPGRRARFVVVLPRPLSVPSPSCILPSMTSCLSCPSDHVTRTELRTARLAGIEDRLAFAPIMSSGLERRLAQRRQCPIPIVPSPQG